MRIGSQKTKLALLLHYVDEWRKQAGSRETVARIIVETHIARGANGLAKLQFDTSGDVFTWGKNAADRIFRWLDDKTKDNNFMPVNFEDSIVAAMPPDIRLAYLNEWLGAFGLAVQGLAPLDANRFNATAHLVAVSKESSEAVGAIAGLVSDPSDAGLARAEKELMEAEEAARAAREELHGFRNRSPV